MKHFKTIIAGLFLLLIPMACGAVVSFDSSKKTNVKNDLVGHYYNGCTYVSDGTYWGVHAGDCPNPIHWYNDILVPDDSIIPVTIDTLPTDTIRLYGDCALLSLQSLNKDYNPCYKIYGVRVSNSNHDVYDVHYTYKEDSLRFIGTLEKCMMKGFDANDIILWSNL